MNDNIQRIADSMRSDFEELVFRTHNEISLLCKSPIEEMLGTALAVSLRLARPSVSQRFSIGEILTDGIVLIPQYRWRQYVIDFALSIPKLNPPFIFIECDGHDFHERTKEQASHDRAKDRAIQTDGIPILRFTGSEIFRDCGSCALQIAKAVRGRFSTLGIDLGEV